MARTSTITPIVRDLLEVHDVQGAIDALIAKAEADPDLYSALTKNALRDGADRAVRNVVTADRQLAWKAPLTAPVNVTKPRAAAIEAWSDAICDSILDTYRLSNGKKLGDGTKDDVMETVQGLEAQAEDMLVKARWMRLIVAGMKGKKTVRQVYDDAAVKALQMKAQAQ